MNFLDEIMEYTWKTGARIEALILPQESFKMAIANFQMRIEITPNDALRFYYDSRWGIVEIKVDTSETTHHNQTTP